MDTISTIKVNGRVRLECYDLGKLDGFIVNLMRVVGLKAYIAPFVRYKGSLAWDTGFSNNLVTNVGKALLSSLLGGLGGAAATYLAVGTSSTAVALTDTTLGAEITDSGLARSVADSISQTTTTTTNDTVQYQKTWSATGTKTVQEVGLLNASSGGTLVGHKLTGAKALTSGQVLVATYSIQFT
jgi:hypothetical protein